MPIPNELDAFLNEVAAHSSRDAKATLAKVVLPVLGEVAEAIAAKGIDPITVDLDDESYEVSLVIVNRLVPGDAENRSSLSYASSDEETVHVSEHIAGRSGGSHQSLVKAGLVTRESVMADAVAFVKSALRPLAA